MKQLLFTLTLFFSIVSFGQNTNSVEKRLKTFQDSLKQNNIDTFLNYSMVCLGGVYPPDTCNFFDNSYLFWKQNGITFLQKFDGCKFYKSVVLDTINPLTFYIAQHKKIDGEKIYHPTYVQSKHGNTVTTIEETIDHTCFYEMTCFIKKKKIFKSVSEYDLTLKKFDNGRKNIYYNYNQQTQLKILIDQTIDLIKQLDKGKKFAVQ